MRLHATRWILTCKEVVIWWEKLGGLHASVNEWSEVTLVLRKVTLQCIHIVSGGDLDAPMNSPSKPQHVKLLSSRPVHRCASNQRSGGFRCRKRCSYSRFNRELRVSLQRRLIESGTAVIVSDIILCYQWLSGRIHGPLPSPKSSSWCSQQTSSNLIQPSVEPSTAAPSRAPPFHISSGQYSLRVCS